MAVVLKEPHPKQDGMRAVLPGLLQRVSNLPVPVPLEPILAEGRPGHVPAKLFETASIAPVNRGAGVYVDATGFGDRRGLVPLGAHRPEGLVSMLPRLVTQELEVAGRGAVA